MSATFDPEAVIAKLNAGGRYRATLASPPRMPLAVMVHMQVPSEASPGRYWFPATWSDERALSGHVGEDRALGAAYLAVLMSQADMAEAQMRQKHGDVIVVRRELAIPVGDSDCEVVGTWERTERGDQEALAQEALSAVIFDENAVRKSFTPEERQVFRERTEKVRARAQEDR